MTSPDTDGDGLNDLREQQIGTLVDDTDTDDDGLLDGYEDGRGLYAMPTLTGSDPLLADTDGDGVEDGAEVAMGRDPNVAEPVWPVPVLPLPARIALMVLLMGIGGSTHQRRRPRRPLDAARVRRDL